jgi:hypothetical protein
MDQPGEITIPSHWSPYNAPTSYPEGTQIHIIVRGDTLWDIANQYFQNPFLWPQLWDANRYIENPHLIYPGDPVRIPDLDVLRAGGPGGPGAPGTGAEGEMGEGVAGGPGGPGAPGGPRGPSFYPAFEEVTIQCAGYVSNDEDDSFRVFGAENGPWKDGLATGDILYVNRGALDGVNPGDQYYIQRKEGFSWGIEGEMVRRTGWGTVLAVQEDTAIVEVTQACFDVKLGDYLIPFEPIPVPLLPVQARATRLTPETGQMRGRVTASLDDISAMGTGSLVSIDLGDEDGVVPGNIFTVFRYLYPGAPRYMIGEIAIITVQRENATGRIIHGNDFVAVDDIVELK